MATRQQNAREFVKTWSSPNKGREDADRQTFWNDLLQRVYGINDYYNYITYEKDVQVKAGGKVTTRRIDGYIPSTKVMIEMKGKKVKDLTKPLKQSGGGDLTPFEQAKRYANFLPNSEQPRWILVSNFNEIDIHDMEKPLATPTVIKLSDLPQKVKLLEFIVNASQQKIIDEKKLSVDAGNLVAKIYHELTNAYAQGRGVDVNSPEIQRSLNMLIVRLVFLLYADDSNLFGKDNIFQAFIERREPRDIRRDLSALFKVLDQPESERDPYLDDEFNQFAYVNGGMFSDENVIIPQFTDELKRLIVEEAGAGFDWSGISPTIFGAVFESTLNPKIRRSGGMHYTSIENIHKVIDPLFLNDLHDEFDKIQNMGNNNQRVIKAREFRVKLGKLKFFDPACGSGNFLTETYLSLRKMENECLRIITGDQGTLAITDDSDPKVKIQNFYGIEINDFAVSVARTAMWIAESQMWEQTKDITFANKDFLPLDSNDSIYEGNALRMDWNDIVKPYELDYIMGNPPFLGKKEMSKEQKKELKILSDVKGIGKTDYVAGWFIKTGMFIQNTTVSYAFVATNSISQGENAIILWNALEKYHLHINFAYKSFVWQNEAKKRSQVHCVILCLSAQISSSRYIFDGKNCTQVQHINPYLMDMPYRLRSEPSKPICNVVPMGYGNVAGYSGFYFDRSQKDAYLKEEPSLNKFIRPFGGAKELLNNKPRYCFWLVDAKPQDLRDSKILTELINNVYNYRTRLDAPTATKKKAETPQLFFYLTQKDRNVIVVPKVTTSRRPYMPILMVEPKYIVNGSALMIDTPSLYVFSMMSSSVHNAWMRAVGGRMKDDYQYSKEVIYNNFPWPNLDKKQKYKLASLGQKILDARDKEKESTLAKLYTETNFRVDTELRKAHEANDKAVLKAYGLKPSATEPEIVQHLFTMYEELTRKDKRNRE